MNDSDQQRIEQQIIDLQSKLTFQEDTVNALNVMVSDQQQDILALKSQMQTLLEELKGLLSELEYGAGGNNRLADIERPPHY